MSYPCSLSEAKAAIKMIEPDNEGDKMGSPVLNGQDVGGPSPKGELAPSHYSLVGDTKQMKRRLGV